MKQLLKIAASATCMLGLCIGVADAAAARLHSVVSGSAHQALFAIAFDGRRGLAVGAPGAILSTEDGGASWKPVTAVPAEVALLGVDIKGDHQIAVGQMGLVLRKDGDSWKKVASGADKSRLLSVSINAKGQAVIAGSFGTVLKSDDGGASWTSIAPDWTSFSQKGMDAGVEPHIYAAKIDEAGVVTVAGEFGLILRSAEGNGKDWKTVHVGDASLFALELRSDGVGYAVGQNGTVLRSSDHGASWTPLDVDTKAILLGVKSVPNGQVVVTGMRDMLLSPDDGKSWTHIDEGEATTSWYEGVAQADAASAFFAVGHSGQIVRVGS